jgi:hypothetical protein
VTGGTVSHDPAGHAEQADDEVTPSEEPAMRHALIPIRLIQDARAASGPRAERQLVDAPPDPQPSTEPTPGRFATLFRRARRAQARTLGLGTESPGGGA